MDKVGWVEHLLDRHGVQQARLHQTPLEKIRPQRLPARHDELGEIAVERAFGGPSTDGFGQTVGEHPPRIPSVVGIAGEDGRWNAKAEFENRLRQQWVQEVRRLPTSALSMVDVAVRDGADLQSFSWKRALRTRVLDPGMLVVTCGRAQPRADER